MWMIAAIALKWAGHVGALSAAGGALFLVSQPALRHAGTAARADASGKPAARSEAVLATLWSTLRLVLVAASLGTVAEFASMLVLDLAWTASAVRIAGLVLLMTLPFLGRSVVGISVVGAALVVVSFALTGHATHDPRWLMSTLVVVHLAAVSFWIGALWPLHRLVRERSGHAVATEVAERFGRQAAWSVATLVLAGTVLAAFLLGSVAALFTTSYGWTLLAKLSLVMLLLALAAGNSGGWCRPCRARELRTNPEPGRPHGACAVRSGWRRACSWRSCWQARC